MSGDPENEYFSDGLSEEILNALAQMPGLRVLRPALLPRLQGKAGKREEDRRGPAGGHSPGGERAQGRVRITAQLVNAADEYHLWSQTFDRELKNIFAIQDEIAAAIAEAMKLRLAPSAGGPSKKPGFTTNPEAYEAYLKGRQALNERTKASIQKALVHFQKAVALDPGFAAAQADAAMLMLGKQGDLYGDIPLPEALARARSFLEKAMALAPDLPKVLGAAGLLEEYALHPERSLELYERALALSPNDGDVRNWRRIVFWDLGRHDQLLAAAEEAVRSDPLSKNNLLQQVLGLYFFGHEAESGPVVERLRSLDETWGHVALGRVAAKRGDKAGAVRHLVPALQEGRETGIPFLVEALASLGLREEALGVARGEHAYVYLALGDFPAAKSLWLTSFRRRRKRFQCSWSPSPRTSSAST
jgi:TolB-like protein